MKTIGAKELRTNLDKVLDRVLSGEDVIVQHRFKNPIRLSAVHAPASTDTKKLAGLHAFEAAPKQPIAFSPNKSVKELYHDYLDDRYSK